MILFYFTNSFLPTNSLNRLISVANMNTIFTCACVCELDNDECLNVFRCGTCCTSCVSCWPTLPPGRSLGAQPFMPLLSPLLCPVSFIQLCDSKNTPVPNLRLIEYKRANCSFKMWQRYFMLQGYWIVLHYCTEVAVILCCILYFDSLSVSEVIQWGFFCFVLGGFGDMSLTLLFQTLLFFLSKLSFLPSSPHLSILSLAVLFLSPHTPGPLNSGSATTSMCLVK